MRHCCTNQGKLPMALILVVDNFVFGPIVVVQSCICHFLVFFVDFLALSTTNFPFAKIVDNSEIVDNPE